VIDVVTYTCLGFALCAGHIEPIPVVLQAVIDHLVLWRLIPESRKPNSVIINFFDEVGVVLLLFFNYRIHITK
jgi:Na+/H+ antiporter NhaD/arsenite permease-like protein